jgi:periplasmic protein TonB
MNQQQIELIVPKFNREATRAEKTVTPSVTSTVTPKKSPEPASTSNYNDPSSVTPPKLVRRVEPRYTADALSRKIEGKVRLSFFVTPNGNVRTIRVIHRLETGLDREAIEALSHWRYSPALVDGRPTTVQITEEIDFRLP